MLSGIRHQDVLEARKCISCICDIGISDHSNRQFGYPDGTRCEQAHDAHTQAGVYIEVIRHRSWRITRSRTATAHGDGARRRRIP